MLFTKKFCILKLGVVFIYKTCELVMINTLIPSGQIKMDWESASSGWVPVQTWA